MKTLILTMSILLGIGVINRSEADYDYEAAWIEVEALISDGLPKSAISKVEEIQAVAKKEQNNPQFVKTVVYIARLTINTDEKGIETSIAKLENIVQSTTTPVKEISASYLAELYQRYFDNNRYTISQRTDIAAERSKDFRTWTSQDFMEVISYYYLMSVDNKSGLTQSVSDYKVIMEDYDEEAIKYRPSVYEVLADKAILFFSQHAAGISAQNTESFQIDNEAFWLPSERFSQHRFTTQDTTNVVYRIITLFQDLLQTQDDRNNSYALADYDMKRLQYVYQNAATEDKASKYMDALIATANKYESIDYYTEIIATIANQKRNDQADSLSSVHAIEWCDKAIKRYPNSQGALRCQNIISDIKRPYIQVHAEQVYTSKSNILLALDYNNVSDITIETIKLDAAFYALSNDRSPEKMLLYFTDAPKIKTVHQSLPASKTFHQQRIEINYTSLPYGEYAVLISTDSNEKAPAQYVTFNVSDLSYTTFSSGPKQYLLANERSTGKPMKGVSISLFKQNYNSNTRKYEEHKIGDYVTNDKGMVSRTATTDQISKVVLTYKKDVLTLGNMYHYYHERNEGERRYAEFFTDRAIYRPGQTVYFKALLLKNNAEGIPNILPNENIEVVFKDANYQEISKINLKSNEYGSVNGSFVIPTGKLNGSFSLVVDTKKGIHGQKQISVEEYKRPTFEIQEDPITSEYKINDIIKVTGQAKTLAGTNVDGATVQYKVTRNARYPDWGYYWRMPYQSEEFIITQGTSTTDADGKYEVSFEAIPDLKVDAKYQPTFHYQIEVEVTDQRGETRYHTTDVTVGYVSMTLTTNISDQLDVQDLKPLEIKAYNLNGQAVTASGNLVIVKLEEPSTVLITRYWEGNIDIPLRAEEYKKYFPQYPQQPSVDYSQWKEEKTVLNTGFDTKNTVDLSRIMSAGVYKVMLTASDKDGKEVSYTKYVVFSDFDNKSFPKTSFLFTSKVPNSIEPSETLSLVLGATDKPIYAFIVIEKDGKVLYQQTHKVDKVATLKFPIIEAYRGGVNIAMYYIVQNRSFQNLFHVSVPWTNKQLDIKYETFRDKTLPGAKEEYRIKIKGNHKDKIAAEMVASMYDASLDQFTSHGWNTQYYPSSYANIRLLSPSFEAAYGQMYKYGSHEYIRIKEWKYPVLSNMITDYGYGAPVYARSRMMKSSQIPEPMMMEEVSIRGSRTIETAYFMDGVEVASNIPETAVQATTSGIPTGTPKPFADISPRKNLQETVFFFPDLKTDADGNIILSFTMNEALTKWRLMTFAHTKDLMTGYKEAFVQTQKNLMVFPNAPRFVRDGDKITFTAKVSNLSQATLTGKSQLTIMDAITMKDITAELLVSAQTVDFTTEVGRSQGLEWQLSIPESKYNAITYRVSAQSGEHTDAEENTIPVITNRILITETFPMWLKGNETKSFTFDALKNNVSTTKKDFKYTFEYTSNPIWYAIQALPYINTANNPSTHAIVDRMYANALASKIANAHPKIKAVFDQWKSVSSDALLSNLSKNQELKTALLEETPWVVQSLSEAEQKRNIALLFDMNTLANDRASTLSKLIERQLPNGGFPWCTGSRDDVYTTQLVIEDLGHLHHLGALDLENIDISNITHRGLKYMDDELAMRLKRLQEQIRLHGGNINDDHLDPLSVQYLYVSTFFSDHKVSPNAVEARDYYYGQAKKYWTKKTLYTQAMIGLVMHRNNETSISDAIIKSLREKSFSNEELGMYWNEGNGFYWYQLPIERHALMIELFTEASSNKQEADQMKIWLLKNKQTTHWKTSKSTAAAIYALLLQGESGNISQWVTESVQPNIKIGSETLVLDPKNVEAGTGYIKKAYAAEQIDKNMANVTITNNNTSIAWGAAYYQYFEALDNVTSFVDTPLRLNKKLFKVIATKSGDQLAEITDKNTLQPGDKLTVRIELRVDRQMEYVHMKDMRPSGCEPLNVISQYKYNGGLGYYETTKDMATSFYFGYLSPGTYVFEYPLTVVHKGDFSSGITTISSMYAPEFSSHSEGGRLTVK